jgi:hypothetical protein
MMQENTPRRYTPDEVNAILRRALDKQAPAGQVTHDELLETARELGIDPSQIEAAADEQMTVGVWEQAREEWKVQRKKKFFEHLRTYAIVNSFLILFSVMTGGWWFLWPLLGWGIGLAFDVSDAFWPKEKQIERGTRAMLKRRERLAARKQTSGGGKLKAGLTIESNGRITIEKGDKFIRIG